LPRQNKNRSKEKCLNRRKITISRTQQQQQQQLWKNSEIGKIEIVHEKVKPLINTQ
jgi:hypothetical protein